MQLGAKETENERFAHYLTKTYRKTASLIAASLKAVSFNSHEEEIVEVSIYGYSDCKMKSLAESISHITNEGSLK